MQCNKVQESLDQLIDSDLEQETAKVIDDHLAHCFECQRALSDAHDLRSALSTLPIEGPRPGFYVHAIKRAQEASQSDAAPHLRKLESGKSSRPLAWQIKLGGAIAAAMVLWIAAGPLYNTQFHSEKLDLPVVAISMETPTPVNLVFSAMEDLNGARVTLQLPPGLEVNGYPGRQMLSWTTNLQKGKNVLKLPLLGHAFSDAEIVARLEHGDDSKTFRLKVRVI